MITREQLEYAVVIFEHLYNYNHMRDAGYKNNQKLYTKDGHEISTIDVLQPAPNPYDHRYDGYAVAHVFRRNLETKFGFVVNEKEVSNLNLQKCFFVVYYRENERKDQFYSFGPFIRINDQEFNYLINQIAL